MDSWNIELIFSASFGQHGTIYITFSIYQCKRKCKVWSQSVAILILFDEYLWEFHKFYIVKNVQSQKYAILGPLWVIFWGSRLFLTPKTSMEPKNMGHNLYKTTLTLYKSKKVKFSIFGHFWDDPRHSARVLIFIQLLLSWKQITHCISQLL